MKTILAIDSAETSGYALLTTEPKLIAHGIVMARTWGDVEDGASFMVEDSSPDLVVIEEPFFHPRTPAAGAALMQLLGRWRQAFERRGYPVLTVPASSWQLRLPGVSSRTRSAERKAAARAHVLERFGVEATEDECDAVCLGLYACTHTTWSKAA